MSPQPGLPLSYVPHLSIARFRAEIELRDLAIFDGFPGFVWRSLFGAVLRKTVCITGLPQCQGCDLLYSCAYPYLFETPPPYGSEKMRLYNTTVHPYVLDPQEGAGNFPAGARITLGLTLLGRGIGHLPLLLKVFRDSGGAGVGKIRSRFEIADVLQETCAGSGDWRRIQSTGGRLEPLRINRLEVPPAPQSLRIRFETPLRLKADGNLVCENEFAFHHLFRNVLRRISMLCYFHDTRFEADFAVLTGLAREIRLLTKSLEWRDLSRWSSRQQTEMLMGGLVGTVDLEPGGAQPFWPFLWLGQWTHAGKGAAVGLGRYRLEDAARS